MIDGGFDILSPMDSFRYFQTPIQTDYTLANGEKRVVAAVNPARVGLIIATNPPSSGLSIGLNGQVGATLGIPIVSQQPTIQITQGEWGALVQAEWWAFSTAGNTVSVIEVILNDWPETSREG